MWREEEIWLSKLIAESTSRLLKNDVPFFILPKGQGPELLASLLYNIKNPKVYISFPITGISNAELKEIEIFKMNVKKHFTSFDPYAIKDRELTLIYHTLEEEIKNKSEKVTAIPEDDYNDKKIWKFYGDEYTPLSLTKLKLSNVELPGRELLSVLETIDSQIISRDYMLIDQSDFIIMYLKEDKGEPRISAGCQSEMIYAYSNGKPVYVIFSGGEKKLSPWVTQYSEVFINTNECLKYIIRKYSAN